MRQIEHSRVQGIRPKKDDSEEVSSWRAMKTFLGFCKSMPNGYKKKIGLVRKMRLEKNN